MWTKSPGRQLLTLGAVLQSLAIAWLSGWRHGTDQLTWCCVCCHCCLVGHAAHRLVPCSACLPFTGSLLSLQPRQQRHHGQAEPRREEQHYTGGCFLPPGGSLPLGVRCLPRLAWSWPCTAPGWPCGPTNGYPADIWSMPTVLIRYKAAYESASHCSLGVAIAFHPAPAYQPA